MARRSVLVLCLLLATAVYTFAFAVSPAAVRFVRAQTMAADKPKGSMSPLNAFKQGIAKMKAGSYDEGATKNFIDTSIKQSNVVVFSWSRCPFCLKAKAVLGEALDADQFTVMELDQRPDGDAIRSELSKMTGRTSVPQIWIGQEFVGGANDGPGVVTLKNKGTLVPMLTKAGCKVKKGVA